MAVITSKNQKVGLDYNRLESYHDLDPLMDRIGEARYVLLGEATHGTHEFYTWRAQLTKRLIREKEFNLIAVEGDWPDCYRINRWIKGYAEAGDNIEDVLKQFKRWPGWMWANWEIAALARWLRDYNDNRSADHKVGFYGLDVYSLWESMEIIVDYLENEDPKAAEFAKKAVDCFEPYGEEDAYRTVWRSVDESCRDQVVNLLQAVRQRAQQYDHDREAGLNAEMNALVAKNGEKYYRSMSSFGENSWNVRDLHMVETLNRLMRFRGVDAKVVIWEHNTHIGDARYTDMADDGLLNTGQLVREQHNPEDVVLIGFGTYEGSVIAGRMWGGVMQEMKIPPAIADSVEDILHSFSPEDKLLIFNEENVLNEQLASWLGHRAIGVVYNPSRERGNYVPTRLTLRYDAFLYLDQTRALHPLYFEPDGHMTPETFPFGI